MYDLHHRVYIVDFFIHLKLSSYVAVLMLRHCHLTLAARLWLSRSTVSRLVVTDIGNHLNVTKPPWYLTNLTGQLSLATPLWICTVHAGRWTARWPPTWKPRRLEESGNLKSRESCRKHVLAFAVLLCVMWWTHNKNNVYNFSRNAWGRLSLTVTLTQNITNVTSCGSFQ